MIKKFAQNPPPAALNQNQFDFVSEIADSQMIGRSAVMRQAIEALRRNPDTVANTTPILPGGPAKVPFKVTMHITPEQSEYVNSLAKIKDVSRSQILRNAVAALQSESIVIKGEQ